MPIIIIGLEKSVPPVHSIQFPSITQRLVSSFMTDFSQLHCNGAPFYLERKGLFAFFGVIDYFDEFDLLSVNL